MKTLPNREIVRDQCDGSCMFPIIHGTATDVKDGIITITSLYTLIVLKLLGAMTKEAISVCMKEQEGEGVIKCNRGGSCGGDKRRECCLGQRRRQVEAIGAKEERKKGAFGFGEGEGATTNKEGERNYESLLKITLA